MSNTDGSPEWLITADAFDLLRQLGNRYEARLQAVALGVAQVCLSYKETQEWGPVIVIRIEHIEKALAILVPPDKTPAD